MDKILNSGRKYSEKKNENRFYQKISDKGITKIEQPDAKEVTHLWSNLPKHTENHKINNAEWLIKRNNQVKETVEKPEAEINLKNGKENDTLKSRQDIWFLLEAIHFRLK